MLFQGIEVFKSAEVFGDRAIDVYETLLERFPSDHIFSFQAEHVRDEVYLEGDYGVLMALSDAGIVAKQGDDILFVIAVDAGAIWERFLARLHADCFLCSDRSFGLLKEWEQTDTVGTYFLLDLVAKGLLPVGDGVALVETGRACTLYVPVTLGEPVIILLSWDQTIAIKCYV